MSTGNTVRRNEDRNEEVIDLLEVGRLLLSHWKMIILSAIILALITFAATYFLITPMYRASATFYVNNSTGNSENASITNADLTASAKLVDTYAAIIKSNAIMDRVVAQLGEEVSSSQIKNNLNAKAVNNTEVFTVSVTHENPQTAVKIVRLITEIAPEQIGEIVEGSSTKIIDYPKMPTGIDSPNYLKNTAIGGILGFILACAFIIIRSLMDNTIKTAADLEYWGIPVLGVIPDFATANKNASYGYGYGSKKRR